MVEKNTILDIDTAVICTSRLPLWYSLHLLVTTGENLTCVQTLACLLPFHPLQVLKRDPDEIRPRMELWEISANGLPPASAAAPYQRCKGISFACKPWRACCLFTPCRCLSGTRMRSGLGWSCGRYPPMDCRQPQLQHLINAAREFHLHANLGVPAAFSPPAGA